MSFVRAVSLMALWLAIVPTAGLQAQSPQSSPRRDPEAGRALLRSYPPEAYNGDAQNWAVLQDRRGVIYVGATGGVMEFDGVTWRRILTPSRTTIRSLAQDDTGKIWVGGVGDLGYLQSNAKGETEFVSL